MQIDKMFKMMPYGIVSAVIHKRKSEICAKDKEFEWDTELMNAFILFMMSFLVVFTSIDSFDVASRVGIVNGGLAFFGRLAVKRGLK